MQSIIKNTKEIIIFDKNNKSNKSLSSFYGSNCNVVLEIGGYKIDCRDHKIRCNLRYVEYHTLIIYAKPIDDNVDFNVIIHYNEDDICGVIIDDTIKKVLYTIVHYGGMYGIKYDSQIKLYNVKLNLQTIIPLLKENKFDELDSNQKELIIDILTKKENEINYTYE